MQDNDPKDSGKIETVRSSKAQETCLMLGDVYIHTYIHICIHTYMHIYLHTYIQWSMSSRGRR